MLETPEHDTNEAGSGFCEICCHQVTSSRYAAMEELKEYLRIIIEALLTVAKVVAMCVYALCMYVAVLFQRREKTAIEKEAEEYELRMEQYSYIRHKVNSISGAEDISDEDRREDHQRVATVNTMLQAVESGYLNPSLLVKEADDVHKERLHFERKDRARRDLQRDADYTKRQSDDAFAEADRRDWDGDHEGAKRKRGEGDRLLHEADLIRRQHALV
jgi:hypothetical protein